MYIVSKRRQITGNKLKNATKTYEKLLRRQAHEGDTAWLSDAMFKATNRLKKMGMWNMLKQKITV